MITAARAYEIGLVNRVVPAADLMAEAKQLAAVLAAKAPVATRSIIEAVNHGFEMSQADAQFLEASLFGLVATTDDMKEGTRAFLEKRKAEWKGK
jgi:enoyl-CoA hydratase